jgi:hypothetical protein
MGLCLNISGTPRKKISFKKKREVDDFCKGSIKQLILTKYCKGRIQVIQ